MAAGTIITVLTNIPWGTVVESAPKIADGASKLWNTVTRWNKSDPVQNGQIDAPQQRGMTEVESLSARLQTLEESIRHLNDQMQASSTLIKDLAEQNTLLVQRIELNRQRLTRFAVFAGGMISALLGLEFYLLLTR